MKKINSLIFSVLITMFSLIIVLIVNGKETEVPLKVPNELNLKIERNENICIKDGMLYNDKDELIKISDNSIYENYKVIYINNFDRYSIFVASSSQDELNDEMLLVTSINCKNTNKLYLLDRESNRVILITSLRYMNNIRINLNSIRFIDEDMFIVEEYDLNNSKPNSIKCIKIVNNDKIFDTIAKSMISEYNNDKSLIENYCITKDYFIVEFIKDNKKIVNIMKLDIKFEYTLTLIKDKYYFSTTSASFNPNKISYDDENYLLDGYFGYYNNSIVYLDNDLNVVDIEKNLVLEKLNNKEEFVNKFKKGLS